MVGALFVDGNCLVLASPYKMANKLVVPMVLVGW